MIKSSAEIIKAAQALSENGRRRRIAVAVAQDADVIGAVQSAFADGICDGSLFGNEVKIKELAEKNKVPIEGLEIINQTDPAQAVMEAVELAATGQADAVMKGFVSTSALLKGVLDKRFNLRTSPTLSHVAVLTIPGYHKLLMLTDGGMVVKPTLEQRFDILKNAILVGKALGIDPVKIALAAATDHVTPKMPQTEDDAKLVKMVEAEKIDGCLAAGPMSFDVATSKEIAARAGIENSVAGDADVYLVGSIEECNVSSKTMIVFGKAIFAGVIVGAKVPVSLVSRTDPLIGKKTSIALACLVSDFYQRMEGGRS
ncbi:MAG: phosphate butyryltransferase [FCB group bacterium]|nr:phosphate butyryltransferase [FCB group bacterium]